MASTAADGVLPELQREMDDFMATHWTTLGATASQTSVRLEIAASNRLEAPLSRLHWMATTLARTRLCETMQFMLSWLTAIEGVRARREAALTKSASWLVGYLVGEILEARLATSRSHDGLDVNGIAQEPHPGDEISVVAVEKMVEQILDRCVVVFQEALQSDAARAIETGGGFFAFKPVVSQLKAPTPDDTLQESVAIAWRRVIALVSLCSLSSIRVRLQKQLLSRLLQPNQTSPGGSSKEYLLLKNLSGMRLGLDVTTFLEFSSVQRKVKDAAGLLKMLQQLTLKPHKTPTRLAAINAIASILHRELDALDSTELQRLYMSFHAVTEWTNSISELHAVTLKVCGKREFAVAAWDLRIALLCVSPNEIFSRYWKEDVHALLRVQYQQNKDGGGAGPQASAVLDCVGRCFTHVLTRHFLNDRRIPGESDCMEIINTTQAWCFFAYPKQRSFDRLVVHVLPVLVQLSVGIASYNMMYSVQSHLRRLLLEADHIFDEKKLVGLKALDRLCELCWGTGVASRLPLDRKVLLANRTTLGELVGQVLIEANALFGGDLLIKSTTAQAAGSAAGVRTANLPNSAVTKLLRDDYRRAIAIRCYACALRTLKHLYVALELSDDQKIMILVRSCIHNEAEVRDSASEALHHVIQAVSRHAGVIFRGVTDYIFRLSNHLTTPQDFDAFLVLMELTTSLLRTIIDLLVSESPLKVTPWETRKAKQESLLQIESAAVYLLVFEDGRLLAAAVTALEVVAQARAAAFGNSDSDTHTIEAATVERPSVMDVLRKAEWQLTELLFSFDPPPVISAADLGCFRQLITELAGGAPRASFRWASCLAVVYAQLAIWSPEVVAFIWSDVNDKVTKLEPAMASLLESDPSSESFDLARWRNLAILATTTACPHLMVQYTTVHDEDDQSRSGRLSDHESIKDGSVQSVISSSAVQALLKRLARFLKSPSNEQKKAVILALGSTHVSSLPILVEVLQKYEPEAFSPIFETPLSASRHGSQIDMSLAVGNAIPMNGIGNISNGYAPRRVSKEQKARNLKAIAQLQLQWALGRCYRLLLHTTQQRPLLFDETTQEAVLRLQTVAIGVIDKTATALMNLQQQHGYGRATALDGRDAPQHLVFMMQQDLCSSIRALTAFSNQSSTSRRPAATTRRMVSVQSNHQSSISMARVETSSSDPPASSSLFDSEQRETWYTLLLSWCHSFNSLANARLSANLSGSFFTCSSPARDHWVQRCDVLAERVDDTLVPWQWVDECDATRALGIQEAAMASFQRFFVCETAFATLPVIVQGPVFLPLPITQDSTVFRWLDECFAVEVNSSSENERENNGVGSQHFQVLQRFCHTVLRAFLQSDFRTFVDICVDKAFFRVSSGDKHNVAKHYFRAVCSVASELQQLLRDSQSATVTSLPIDAISGETVTQRRSLCTTASTIQNLQVRVCHVILMHLGIENDPPQRQQAADLINALYGDDSEQGDSSCFRLNASVSSGKRSHATFAAQVTSRMQVAGASFLVVKLSSLAYPMGMSILKFLSCCEAAQQKKSLVVVLPWLAEVSLGTPQKRPLPQMDSPSDQLALPSAIDADQLLSLMFRITSNLGTSCSDQLEQAWLTLAFAEPGSEGPSHQPQRRDSNLSKVVHFLFLQRTTSVRLATAKIVVWWLCRWQSAAHEVVREALVLVETRRRESAAVDAPSSGEISSPTIQPVDDVFVFVILMSDSCCHLATIPSYLYQHPALRETMMVQAVHFGFLALFALVLDPKAFVVQRTAPHTSGNDNNNLDDHQHQSIYVDASGDCLVLLRNLLGHLHGPVELLGPIVEDLAAWSRSWEAQAQGLSDEIRTGDRGSATAQAHSSAHQLETLMGSFASCLPPSLRNAWALECVKEISLALEPGSTFLQQTLSRCNNAQVLLCVRFGLLGYRVLAPDFHGDVFLTLLDVLHHALDEHGRDPTSAGAVVGETLDALRSMVACMPSQKLVLYPQILWVCVALLNHGDKSEPLSFHTQIMELLVEILKMPHFATNQLLQDVLLSKKPPQWSDDQASVMRTLVWSMDKSPVVSQRLALPTVASFLVLPSPVFHANSIEHLIIISMTLLPFIVANAMRQEIEQHTTELGADESEDDESISALVGTPQQAIGLQIAWLAVGSEALGDVFSMTQRLLSHDDAAPEDDAGDETIRSLVNQFAAAFVPELVLLGGEDVTTLVTLCFEILVKILAAEDLKKRCTREKSKRKTPADVVTATLLLVEALMTQLTHNKLAWRPTSVLLGSLARLVRSPEQSPTWQAAVRIMSCLGPSHRTTSAANVVRFHPQLTVSTTSTSPPSSGHPVAQPLDSPVIQAHKESTACGVGTPGKKDGAARKFMNFMGHRSSAGGGSTHSSPNHNQTSHAHATPTGRPSLLTKKASTAQDPSNKRRDL